MIGLLVAVVNHQLSFLVNLSLKWFILGIIALFGAGIVILKPWIGYLILLCSLPLRSFSIISSGILNVRVSEAIFLILIIALSLKLLSSPKALIKTTSLGLPLILLYLWMIISFLWSDSIQLAAIQSTRVLFGMMIFFITIQILDSAWKLKQAINIWVATGCIIGLAAIYEFWHLGLPYLIQFESVSSNVYTQALRSSVYLSPTLLSSYFNLGIFFAIGILLDQNKLRNKILSMGAISILLIAQIFTFSRGGWAGFMIGIFFLFYKLRLLKKLLLIGLIAAVLFLVISGGRVKDAVSKRVVSFTQPTEDAAFQERLLLWQATQNIIYNNLLIGVGIGNSELAYEELSVLYPTRFRYTHSLYLNLLSEIGLIGLSLFFFVCFCIVLLIRNYSTSLRQDRFRTFMWCCSAGLISYAVHGAVHFHLAERHIWAFLGVTMAIITISRVNNNTTEKLKRIQLNN
jgi:O-antigen ligase